MNGGIVIVDKPSDWTSHDVVAKLRGAYRQKRIGHGGTLDPMATGVLPVFVGRATRAVQFVESADKVYLARLRLGLTTDTQDAWGNVLAKREVNCSAEDFQRALDSFTGAVSQIPPMYSAIKIGGKKLYELARKGLEIERKPRDITIHSIEWLSSDGKEHELLISCSKGTYIRTLCHDIGASLGCGGHMSALRRVSVGAFTLSQAHPLPEILEAPESFLLPVDSLFSGLPQVEIGGADEAKLRNGADFPFECGISGEVRVYNRSGEFLALAECADGLIKTIKSFYEV